MAVGAPEVVDGSVVSDCQEPGTQNAAGRVEEFGPVPQRQERLLDDLGGDPAIPARPGGLRHHGSAVSAIEMGKGILGTLDQPLNEARFGYEFARVVWEPLGRDSLSRHGNHLRLLLMHW